jgi:hypothetical protein
MLTEFIFSVGLALACLDIIYPIDSTTVVTEQNARAWIRIRRNYCSMNRIPVASKIVKHIKPRIIAQQVRRCT